MSTSPLPKPGWHPIQTFSSPTVPLLKHKLRELRHVFDALDEHDDGEVNRDELLASLDLDHPHLMGLLKASPAVSAEAGGEGGDRSGNPNAAKGHHSRRGSNRREDAVAGPATLSAFDAIEANDDEFVGWGEVRSLFLDPVLPGVLGG